MTDWTIQVRQPGAGGSWKQIAQFMDLWFRHEINALPQMSVNIPLTGLPNPKLFYNMETLTPDGKMDDLSPTGDNGTITGTTDVAGQYGRARSFNGSSDINAGNVLTFGTSPFSVSFWINWTDVVAQRVIISKGDDTVTTTHGWSIQHNTLGRIIAEVDYNGSVYSALITLTAYNDGNWHHVVVIFDRNLSSQAVLSIYVDNSLVRGPGVQAAQTGSADNSLNLEVGMQNSTTTKKFIGSLDEVYIFPGALNSSQVTYLFNNYSIPNDLVVGNEIRVLDTASNERFRGMIRESTNDPIFKTQKVISSGKAIRLQDRLWASRRSFPNVLPSTVFDELMNSPEGEPSAGLVLFYDMETLTSTALMQDFSVSNANGTITGTSNVTGKWGIAQRFPNGTANRISFTTPSSLNFTGNFTISCFIIPNTSTASVVANAVWKANTFTPGTGTSDYGMSFSTNAGGTAFTIFAQEGNTQVSSTTVNFTVGVPVHVAAVWNGTNTIFYVNGSFLSSTSGTNPTNVGSDFTIGENTTNAIWDVSIDELRVYNRALTATEIKQLAGLGILEGGIGTVDTSLPMAPPRVEGDRRLQVIDSYCRALGAEWYVDQNGSDQDRLNIVSRIGNASSVQTFQLSKNCSIGNRQLNNDTIYNDITVFGVGDGRQQLKSRNFSATTLRTNTTAIVTSSQTTSIAVSSTTSFPTTGVIYIGMERILYSGTDATHIGTTSITRAYQTDGISSYTAYQHNLGMEVYLSSDTTTSPATFYTAQIPQTNSQVFSNGWRSGNYTDKTITDQNTLDFLAYNLIQRYQNPRESLQISFPSNTLTATIGDAITVNDSSGNAFGSTPYRIVAYEWDWDTKIFKLELLPNSTPHASGGFIDTPSRMANRTAESTSDLESYGVVGGYPYSVSNTSSQTITTTTELAAQSILLSGVKAGTKLLYIAFVNLTAGTNTTAITLRIRKGAGTGGTIEASDVVTVSGGQSSNHLLSYSEFETVDNPIHTVTVQQTSATGNGTVNLVTFFIHVSI